MWKKEGEQKGSARGTVHWGCYYATALDVEVDPQCCQFGSCKSELPVCVYYCSTYYSLCLLLGICNYVELIDTIFTDVEGVDYIADFYRWFSIN